MRQAGAIYSTVQTAAAAGAAAASQPSCQLRQPQPAAAARGGRTRAQPEPGPSPALSVLEELEEQAVLGVGQEEGGQHQGLHRHELDEDVEGGAGGVLERVAHGVADDGGLQQGRGGGGRWRGDQRQAVG